MLRYLLLIVLLLVTACDGSTSPEDIARRWADAVVQEDWATTQQLSSDSDLQYGIWHGLTITLHNHDMLEAYHLTGIEQHGATTEVKLQFTSDKAPLCTTIYVDEAGKVSAPHIYLECAPKAAIR